MKTNIYVNLATEHLSTESAVRKLLELISDSPFTINSISANTFDYTDGITEEGPVDVPENRQ